jgi:hypothetical protein
MMSREIESKVQSFGRQELQLKSLLATAKHEQLNILQPLIYEDPVFQTVLDVQKIAEGLPFMPLRAAAFSTACDVKEPELREQMTEGDLYNAQDRMEFIQRVAKKYHGLMLDERHYMEREITEISKWKGKV